jgi:hypothetical protein
MLPLHQLTACIFSKCVDFEPWDNFCFCECENGHFSKETGKFVALNEHTSMTVRDIAYVVGVGKSNVSKVLCA